MRSLSEWLHHIEELFPRGIDLGLERIGHVWPRLALPRWKGQVVTVAGTNGKGSCIALLEAIGLAAGLRVAATSSPHLLSFTERLRVQGQTLDEADWCRAFQAVEEARGATPLTYFEFSTLASLWLIAQEQPDWVLLEIGMGGRLDAFNIVDADVALISSIDLDHTQWLGSTREAILGEKMGVARPGRPVVFAESNAPANLQDCIEQHAAFLSKADQHFGVEQDEAAWNWWSKRHGQRVDLPETLLGLENAAAVLEVIGYLQVRTPIDQAAITQGLSTAQLMGRWQKIPGDIDCYLDVAHNPAASARLAKRLSLSPVSGTTRAVIGMLNDKDLKGTLEPLLPWIDEWYVADLSTTCERGATAEGLEKVLVQFGDRPVKCFPTVAQAYHQALADAGQSDRVVAFGSFYTVAGVLAAEELASTSPASVWEGT